MKKLIYMSAFLLVSSIGFAQIQKGDVQLGGSLGFTKQEASSYERSYFSVQPRAGLFVSDLTSLGLTVGYQHTDANSSKVNMFTFGVYSRFHKIISDQFYLYLQPSLTFGTGKHKSIGSDINSIDLGIAPGMTYFFSPKFAAEMNFGSLYYSNQKEKLNGNESTIKNYGLNMNLTSVTLGFSYYIK